MLMDQVEEEEDSDLSDDDVAEELLEDSSVDELVPSIDIVHRPIDPCFWTSIHGVMSKERIMTQEYKKKGDAYFDNALCFGQLMSGTTTISRNQCFLVGRPYYCCSEGLSRLRIKLAKHNLRLYAEPIIFRGNSNSWLIVVMDSGVCEQAAIGFARMIDRECTM
jgi:hypothetical protein